MDFPSSFVTLSLLFLCLGKFHESQSPRKFPAGFRRTRVPRTFRRSSAKLPFRKPAKSPKNEQNPVNVWVAEDLFACDSVGRIWSGYSDICLGLSQRSSVPVAADESRFNNKTSPGEELVSPICPNREGCCLGFRESLCFVSQSRPRIFIFSFFPVDLLHLVLPADSLRRSLTLSLSLALPFGAAVPPTDGVRLKIESRKLIKHFRRRIFLPRGSYF